ncbi:MAG TPA: YceG family protein [Desulfosporosinus sp.]|nr:YceG family protein [Desulfosporosinus sp.]
MEARKGIRTVLKHSVVIFKDILSPLIDRGASSDVYFYRIIGCDHEEKYLAEIVRLDEKLRSLGNYIFIDRGIKIASNSSSIDSARKLLMQVPLNDYSNGALLNVLETHGYFSLTSNLQVNQKIKDAFGIMLNLYMTNERAVNLSIIMNFVMKVLLWFVDYGKQVGKKSSYNPKIIYWGSPKTHEVYFLILMSLIGCDVLVLNTSFNDKFDKVDKLNEFSFLINKVRERQISAFPTKESLKETQTRIEESRSLVEELPKLEENTEAIVVKLKKSETIFEEIFVPLTKRSGYVGGPFPILPTYFMRYIGVPGSSDDWEAEYYNSLYNLDNAFKTSGFYLKFLDGIPAPSAAESDLIPQRLIGYPYRDRYEILEQLLQANILLQTYDQLLNNTVRKTFVDSVNLFAEKSSNLNTSIVLNFSLKLVTWFNRYLPKLLTRSNRNKKFSVGGLDYEHNPKILFYGTIKPHEIYLLNAFHKMGCDVLFIHPDEEGDQPFRNFDNDKLMTQVMRNEHNLPLTTFPEGERLIRKSTIAYKASKEIEEVIYNEEVGLFKPWQFESYSTQPITIKTTFDELKILWREPAKLRPEFKVQNKKVYVPNLFAKINGVSEDLNSYWLDLKALSSASNTRLLEDVPFTKISYTKQELYQADYLLNEQGLFDELKVMKSPHYKFGYLKGYLQHFLIVKINELLSSGMFLATVDVKFKLKIIMTILTMDDSLIKLIEVFDYPQEIPKVIVYDNEKETFSENDAILLAYFNLIGLDVIIFTPTNYKTIEQQIKPSLFDVHQLPFVKYDLALPSLNSISAPPVQKPGLFSRFFNLT